MSPQTPKLYEAMSKAQAEIKGALKTAKSHKHMYATLEDVWDACREPLTKNGLCVIQPMRVLENGRMIIDTIIGHSSGEEKMSSAYIPLTQEEATPQAVGSAITYFRRYMLMSVVGICPTNDDDGEKAEAATNRSPKVTQLNEKPVEIRIGAASPAQMKLINDFVEKKAVRERTTSDNITAAMYGEFGIQPGSAITSDKVNGILDWLGYTPKARSA